MSSQMQCQRRIIEAVGLEAALRLLRARGGTRMRIPQYEDHYAPLVELLGSPEAVAALRRAFAGCEWLYVPKADKLIARERDAAIRRERLAGATVAELALRYDLTSAWVKRICRDMGDDARAAQMDLFQSAT